MNKRKLYILPELLEELHGLARSMRKVMGYCGYSQVDDFNIITRVVVVCQYEYQNVSDRAEKALREIFEKEALGAMGFHTRNKGEYELTGSPVIGAEVKLMRDNAMIMKEYGQEDRRHMIVEEKEIRTYHYDLHLGSFAAYEQVESPAEFNGDLESLLSKINARNTGFPSRN